MIKTVSIFTFNIHKGYSTTNFRYTLTEIYKALRTIHVDIVFLQEVVGKSKPGKRSADTLPGSQLEVLADTLWPHFAYGKNAIYGEAHHGNAILSRYPIARDTNVNLSTNRFEKRGLLHAVVHIPEHAAPVHCFNVHLNLFERGRMKQLNTLVDYVHSEITPGDPFLLAGDFNDWTERFSSQLEERLGVTELFKSCHGKHARTFPSLFPFLKLDRIYGYGVKAVHAHVLTGKQWHSLSDHAPILVEISV